MDSESARQRANGSAWPWGSHGPKPAGAREKRQRVAAKEPTAFAAAVRQAEREARREQGYTADAALDGTAQAAVSRVALREVLLAAGTAPTPVVNPGDNRGVAAIPRKGWTVRRTR